MKSFHSFALPLLMLIGSTVQAAITTTGNTSPGHFIPGPIYTTTCYIGKETDGTLLISKGSILKTTYGYIGYGPNANGQATISGTGSAWNIQDFFSSPSGNRKFHIGYEGHGILNINGGGTVQIKDDACLGYKSSSSGTATVEGQDSTLYCGGDLFVGEEGTGTLNILDQGLVEIDGNTAVGNNGVIYFDNGTLNTYDLDAQDSQLTGTGTINIYNVVHDDVDVTIKSTDDLIQTTILNSQPSQNIAINQNMSKPGEVIIGNTGNASLAITNGMQVTSTNVYFGYQAGSTGTGVVSGENSAWNISNSLYVGYGGTSELSVDSGATITCSRSNIGTQPGSNGTVTISDANSTWNYSSMTVGYEGTGVLNITNGAKVNKISLSESDHTGCFLGGESGSSGIVNVSGPGSTLDSGWILLVGWQGYGELNITDGGTVNSLYDTYGYCIGLENTGKVTISGTDSTWNIETNLCISSQGYGELNLLDHGTINVGNFVQVANNKDNNTGKIHFENGTLNTNSLLAGSDHLTGTGTINAEGLVADGIDLVFNTEHGLQQTFHITGDDKDIEVNLDCDQPIYMGAGYLGHGTLTVEDGLEIHSDFGYLGYKLGSDGEATVSGTGSTWEVSTPNNSASNLYVGYQGHGHLNILDGGTVSVQDETHLAYLEGSSGSIHFDNGTLTTAAFYGGADQLTGTGTINTNGIVTDGADIVFDATSGSQPTFTITGPKKNITVNLNQSDTEVLGVGYTGSGSMTVRDGITVSSSESYLGYKVGATGTATVTGNDSTWNAGDLNVGYQGDGHLHIVNGGTVNSDGDIGCDFESTGTVTISGNGSTWNCNEINIGFRGNGTLNITNGGTVIENGGTILGYCAGSSGTINVSGVDSTWNASSTGNLFGSLIIGLQGEGRLNITDGGTVVSKESYVGCSIDLNNSSGFVTVSDTGSMWINSSLCLDDAYSSIVTITNGGLVRTDLLEINDGPCSINLATGGMLALAGEADTSLEAFLELVYGTEAIRWWDDSAGDWTLLTTATMGTDYTLDYYDEGDLAGYTVLTVMAPGPVPVPEPECVALLLSAILAMGWNWRRRRKIRARQNAAPQAH